MSNLPTEPLKPWRNVSASQIATFRSCPTKWWWEKIRGIRTPETPARTKGKRLHKEWERYLVEGIVPQDPIAVSSLEHLPPPGSVSRELVETRIDQTEGLPVPLIGYIDLIEAPTSGRRRVTDHKTTSDFKWCRAPEELATDPQALVYCAEYLRRYPGGPVAFRHVYARTKGRPESDVREVSLTPEWVDEHYRTSIVKTAHEMATYATANVRDVPYKTTACDRYGGCPHRGLCLLVGKQLGGLLDGLFGGSMDPTSTAIANLSKPAPVLPDQEPQVFAEFDSVEAQTDIVRFYSTKVSKAARVQGVPVFIGQLGSMGLGDSNAVLGENASIITGLGVAAVSAIVEGRCVRAFYGSCATSPCSGALYVYFGALGAPSTVTVSETSASAAPAGLSAAVAGPTVNPPDGTPATEIVTEAQAANKPRNKSQGPYLKDGTRVRGLNAVQSLQRYGAEIAGLSPEEHAAWRANTEPAMLAWYEAGCPDTGKAAILKRDIVTDAIALELIVESIGRGDTVPQASAATSAPVQTQPSVFSGVSTDVQQMTVVLGSNVPATDAPTGFYRSSKGYLVEITGECDEAGSPLGRFWNGSKMLTVPLIPGQPLWPTNEDWDNHREFILPDDLLPALQTAKQIAQLADPEQQAAVETKAVETKAVEEQPAMSPEIAAETAVKVPALEDGGRLYIGCYPIKGVTPVLAEDLLRPFFEQVAAANQIPYYALLDYGKGPRQVVALLLNAVKQDPSVLPADLVIDPRHPAGDALAEALAPLYATAIKRIG